MKALFVIASLVLGALADQSVYKAQDTADSQNYIVVLKNDPLASSEEAFQEHPNLNSASLRMIRHRAWLMGRMSHLALQFNGEDSLVHDFFSLDQEFEGYSGRFSSELLSEIQNNEDVEFVEADQTMKAYLMPPTQQAKAQEDYVLRNGTTWGLARISKKEKLSSVYAQSLEFQYKSHRDEQGEGSTVYVLDTGIFTDHNEFEDRASHGKTTAWFSNDEDVQGHGSHCAGTIGGKTYGVAPKAKLVAVKVLGSDGSGATSWIIKGIEWVIKQHSAAPFGRKAEARRSIISMSLGGSYSRALNRAADAAVRKNIFVSIAAGNEDQDACDVSPASAELAFTVGASTIEDRRPYFSNWGKCVDIFAPGVDVYSAKNSGKEDGWFASGTSMATPHVSGVVAAIWSGLPANTSVQELKEILIERAHKDALTELNGSPNVLLNLGHE
jgi:cerevisin